MWQSTAARVTPPPPGRRRAAPRRALPGERARPLPPGAAALGALGGARRGGRRDRVRPGAGVAGRQVGRRVAAHLPQGRGVGREGGHPCGHRLEHGQAEPLLARGHEHRDGARPHGREAPLGEQPEPLHAVVGAHARRVAPQPRARRADHGPAMARRTPGAARGDGLDAVAAFLWGSIAPE